MLHLDGVKSRSSCGPSLCNAPTCANEQKSVAVWCDRRLVTFLLDEPLAHMIAPKGCTAPEVLQLCAGPELSQQPLPALPKQLDNASCPSRVFAFLLHPAPPP